MDYKYQGIILGKKDIAEVDRIYTIYTLEMGKIRVIGKGVRKPNAKLAGAIESVTYCEIFISRTKGLGKITGSIVVNNFPNIKSDIDFIQRVFYVFKILDKLISEQEKDEEIFYLILGYLESVERLSGDEAKLDILTMGLLFKLLSELGYGLEVERCTSCTGRLFQENNYFSVSRGGVLCKNCAASENKKIKISNEAIKIMRIFFKNRVENLIKLRVPAKDIQDLRLVMQEALVWISGNRYSI